MVVFENAASTNTVGSVVGSPDTRPAPPAAELLQYRFLAEFQSHEPEFDYLKSLEIEERISSLRWCRGSMGCKMLLSTNDKTIKLWKIYGKKIKTVSNMNLSAHDIPAGNGPSKGSSDFASGQGLRLPRLATCQRVVTATPKRVFSNAHAYHINTLALNSDGESFLSCDDLRLNLWHLDVSSSCFNIVDVKPSSMEALSEVITSSDCHPAHCQMFIYSSSRGSVRLGDMRASALCDKHAKAFEIVPDSFHKSFFSEITTSISSAKFSPDGRYIVSRDFMNVHLWDVHMESKPMRSYQVHEHLRPKLCDLYDNEAIFDKFEVSCSFDSRHVLTGSYQKMLRIMPTDGLSAAYNFEVSHNSQCGTCNRERAVEGNGFSSRILLAAFHPRRNVIALAATSTLYIFQAAHGG